jgi:hypothetical protein
MSYDQGFTRVSRGGRVIPPKATTIPVRSTPGSGQARFPEVLEALAGFTREELLDVQAVVNRRLTSGTNVGYTPLPYGRGMPRRRGVVGPPASSQRGMPLSRDRWDKAPPPKKAVGGRPAQTAFQRWRTEITSRGLAPRGCSTHALFARLQADQQQTEYIVGFTRYRDMMLEAGKPAPDQEIQLFPGFLENQERTRQAAATLGPDILDGQAHSITGIQGQAPISVEQYFASEIAQSSHLVPSGMPEVSMEGVPGIPGALSPTPAESVNRIRTRSSASKA